MRNGIKPFPKVPINNINFTLRLFKQIATVVVKKEENQIDT